MAERARPCRAPGRAAAGQPAQQQSEVPTDPHAPQPPGLVLVRERPLHQLPAAALKTTTSVAANTDPVLRLVGQVRPTVLHTPRPSLSRMTRRRHTEYHARGSPGFTPRPSLSEELCEPVNRKNAPGPRRFRGAPWPRWDVQITMRRFPRPSPCQPSDRTASSSWGDACPAICWACSRVPPFERYAILAHQLQRPCNVSARLLPIVIRQGGNGKMHPAVAPAE